MIVQELKSIEELAKRYFTHNPFGFDDWVVVKISEIKEEHTILIMLANPISYQLEQVTVKNYTSAEIEEFRATYTNHYLGQLDKRFGFFTPSKNTGDVEYEDFDLYKKYWIEYEGKNIVPFNIPLLFDFPSDLEYSEAVQSNTITVNYQRCIAIIAQPRKKQIKTLFIKNMTEIEFKKMKEVIIRKTYEVKGSLFK